MKTTFLNTDEKFELKQYEVLLSAIPGGVVITKADDTFTRLFANQGYYDLVGYSKKEHIEKFGNVGIATLHPDQVAKATTEAKKQLAETGTFKVKAKLSHKDKEYIWVQFSGRLFADNDDTQLIYIVIVDITEHIELSEQFAKEHKFNNLISSLTDDGFFDCDITKKTIRYSKNFADKMGVPEIVTNYPISLFDKNIIPKETMPYYIDRFTNKYTDAIIEEELHLKAADGKDVWYLYRYNIIHDDDGVPVRAIGKMTNVTEQHLKMEELTQKANKDQLTGLYNKSATELLIKDILTNSCQKKEKHALFIIDIDNFKTINDKLGHLYGDIVLTQLSDILKPLFRADDIVGRVGGDEFFVFIKNYKSANILKQKAQEICRLFCKTYSESDTFVSISASIGIALFPEHATEFDELYKSADISLYKAKALGKNQYSFFEGGKTANVYKSTRTEIDTQGYIQKNFHENRIEYIFKLLYSSENPEMSVKSVLRLITEHFGFSRGYIFETSTDGLFTSNTFEWCIDGIEPQIDNLQNMPIKIIEHVNEDFKKSGMHILQSIKTEADTARQVLEPQNIKSIFLFGIMKDKNPIGFIGFDDCENERIPTNEEIDEICTICQILATFLLKHRTTEQKQQRFTAIETVMDTMNSLAYVIDYATYEVLFENKKVVQFTQLSSLGKKCYKSYRDFESPCQDCPMRFLSDDDELYSTEIHNTKYDVYVRTDASWLNWIGDRKACLINSIDITQYKKEQSK